MGLKNNFGWSISREDTFDSCPRRYFFHYYLSWGGWMRDAPSLSREAFLLKRLVSLPLWRGQLVHYITAKVLQSIRSKGRIPREKDVIGYTEERVSSQLRFSSERRYVNQPKSVRGRLNIDWLALFEHEYGINLSFATIEKTREEIIRALKNLLKSPILELISKTDSSHWIIENIDFSEFAQSFTFKGVDVYVKTDFIFRSSDGSLKVIDWKTYRGLDSGKDRAGPESADQLAIYGYYAATQLGERPANIELVEVNLLDEAREKSMRIDRKDLLRAEYRLESGISKLAGFLIDADTERNEPLPPDRFRPLSGRRCRYCNFRRICDAAV